MYPQQKAKPDEVVVFPKEMYKGQINLDAEVKQQQIHYYTWGTLFFQTMMLIFLFTFFMFVMGIVISVVGWLLLNEAIKGITF
jgi:hypothetical protein